MRCYWLCWRSSKVPISIEHLIGLLLITTFLLLSVLSIIKSASTDATVEPPSSPAAGSDRLKAVALGTQSLKVPGSSPGQHLGVPQLATQSLRNAMSLQENNHLAVSSIIVSPRRSHETVPMSDFNSGSMDASNVVVDNVGDLFTSKDGKTKNHQILVPSLLPIQPTCNISKFWPGLLLNFSPSKDHIINNSHLIDTPAASEKSCRRDYTFNFVPFGFFGRVIVRIMRFTTPVYFWRNGIISEYKGKKKSQVLSLHLICYSSLTVISFPISACLSN